MFYDHDGMRIRNQQQKEILEIHKCLEIKQYTGK